MREKMRFKKRLIILMLAIFLVSIAAVSAADANDTIVASEDANQIELSSNNVIDEDNLKTSENNAILAQDNDDETISAEVDSEILTANQGTFSNLRTDIANGGNLTKSYYKYQNNDGSTIEITTPMTINGNGAIIDMAGAGIRTFFVSASGVTFNNLTIINGQISEKYITGIAIYFRGSSACVTNCNFFNNHAIGDHSGGGAIFFEEDCTVTNCNFTDNSANEGGAMFMDSGTVSNCNFVNNAAKASNYGGGAILMDSGTISNCNFTNNAAAYGGGAVLSLNDANVTNCNFTNNAAAYGGGAIYLYVRSANSTVTNCIFVKNTSPEGGAIFSRIDLGATVDICIFKTDSDTTYQTRIIPPTLDVDNFTTAYDSGEKLTFDLKTNSSMPVENGIISISVYKNNGSWFGNYSCLSGEGWTVDLPAGSYYAIYNTEYAGFQAINRTITINKIRSDLDFGDVTLDYGTSTNVTVTTKGAVGITAKINDENVTVVNNFTIPISGLNAGNYPLTVTTIADANHVAVTKTAKITVNKVDSALTVNNVVFNYGGAGSVAVAFTGATGITAEVIGQPKAIVIVKNNTITVSNLNAGTYNLTVTTIPDDDHNAVARKATITVIKAKTQITANEITATYNVNKDLVITLKDSNGHALSGVKVNINLNGAKTLTTDKNGQVKVPTKDLAAKTYAAKITFGGDTNYDKSTKEVKVTVKKATPKIAAGKKTFKAKTKTKKYAITLKNNVGKAMKNEKVTIKIGKKTYSAKTDAKGKATFKITKLTKKGTYKAVIKFAGNKNYLSISKKVKIKVK